MDSPPTKPPLAARIGASAFFAATAVAAVGAALTMFGATLPFPSARQIGGALLAVAAAVLVVLAVKVWRT